MTACPKCGLDASRVIESRVSMQGVRRRRRECELCKHRWTTSENAIGELPKPRRRKPGRITEEHVRLALTRTDLSHRAMAELIGCTAEAVRQIRNGTLHSEMLPGLLRPNDPKPSGPSCDKCSHWTGKQCGFGFPDPLVEGLLFAVDCDLYSVTKQFSG
jgi:hypothetical protein